MQKIMWTQFWGFRWLYLCTLLLFVTTHNHFTIAQVNYFYILSLHCTFDSACFATHFSIYLIDICNLFSGWSDKERVAVSHELSDVLIYLVRLADRCNIDLSTGVLEKFEINKLKYPVDVVKGCSKKYTEYQIADDAKKSEVQQ